MRNLREKDVKDKGAKEPFRSFLGALAQTGYVSVIVFCSRIGWACCYSGTAQQRPPARIGSEKHTAGAEGPAASQGESGNPENFFSDEESA